MKLRRNSKWIEVGLNPGERGGIPTLRRILMPIICSNTLLISGPLSRNRYIIQIPMRPAPRGGCFSGPTFLSGRTGLTTRTIRTCLNYLKSTNRITIKTDKQVSIISIINWGIYQGDNNATDNTERHTERQASDKEATSKRQHRRSKRIRERSKTRSCDPQAVHSTNTRRGH